MDHNAFQALQKFVLFYVYMNHFHVLQVITFTLIHKS